jgi:regulation of enolase protein 1 (concanavalin A-like superfamily)
MKIITSVRLQRIIIAMIIVAIFPLLIYQFVGAMPPAQDGEIPDGGGMPELSEGGKPITPVFVQENEELFTISPNDVNRDVEFDIWYGPVQNYGQIGNPQPWVDILGRVIPSDSGNKINSLTYSLNGNPAIPLSIGPDSRRLAQNGDFHIELDTSLLNNGPNTVLVKAIDNGGQQGETTVTVNYTAGNTWPMNYTADWSSTSNILDLAQVVDGAWWIVDGKLEPFYARYDRLVAIGDLGWTDYEVTVPVTINGLNADGFKPINAGPGLGFILRWPGYFQKASEQPRGGWENLGAILWNRWKKDSNGIITSGLQAIEFGGKEVAKNPDVQLDFGVTYIYKASVQTVNGTNHIYRFKVWEQGQPEPNEWDIEFVGAPGGPTSGSLGLMAHFVDASFGNVTVKPLSSIKPNLTVNVVGNGSVTKNPDKANYNYGEIVELTANPAADHALGRWSGDLSGRQNPISLTLTIDTEITAHIVPEEYVNISVTTNGGGVVNQTPLETQYLIGEELTLEAVPDPGYYFDEWRQGLTGSENPRTFIVQQAMTIRAIFELIPVFSLEILPPVGQGTVIKDPDQTQYEEGQEVMLTAQPEVGYVFQSWTGDLSGDENPATLVMDSNKSVGAVFVEGDSYSLNVQAGPNGQVLKSPNKASYAHGEIVTLTAVPDAGYMLGAWGGALAGNSSPSILAMTDNWVVTASFVPAVDPQSDDFNRCELDNGNWSTLDPSGDGIFIMTGENLEIFVPGGSSHDMWTNNNTAPRAFTPAENTNFEVEVKFDSVVSQSFQMQGILIRQDNDNFLRFDFHHDGTNMRIFSAKFLNGVGSQTNNAIVTGNPSYMRIKRIGNQWHQYYSEDGLNWILSKNFSQALNVSAAGVFAGNAGGNPQFTASIDYFFNTAMPIVPEDATEYTLDVTTNGTGTVTVNPLQDNYSCDDEVQLTAVPGEGAQFSGWSGDLSGSQNPATLIIRRNHSVTANFTIGSNIPPEFGPLSNQFAAVGEELSFIVSATDPDGPNPPSLSVTNKPAAATFTDNGDGTGEFKWTPTSSDLGKHTVTFEASDGQLVSTKNVTIDVREELLGEVFMPIILYSN